MLTTESVADWLMLNRQRIFLKRWFCFLKMKSFYQFQK